MPAPNETADRPITEPIPLTERHLTGIDVGVLWSTMGISLLGVVAGAGLIAYGAGLSRALIAIVVGGLIGGAMLAAAAALGASSGQTGMVVLRRALGTRGSYIPTVLNIAQGFGWSTFEILVIAEAARLVVGVDAMLKSANVELVGPMKQIGNALCNAVVSGDVAAVKAAIDAGAAAASQAGGEVVSAHVIARPDDAIDGVLPKDAARAPRK